MSGHSYSEDCPVCNESMSARTDWKPFNCVSGECLECGFYYWTESSRMTLKEINSERMELDDVPIKKRKQWDKASRAEFLKT